MTILLAKKIVIIWENMNDIQMLKIEWNKNNYISKEFISSARTISNSSFMLCQPQGIPSFLIINSDQAAESSQHNALGLGLHCNMMIKAKFKLVICGYFECYGFLMIRTKCYYSGQYKLVINPSEWYKSVHRLKLDVVSSETESGLLSPNVSQNYLGWPHNYYCMAVSGWF